MTKTEIKKTTDWLKKNGLRFEVYDDGVHVESRITVSNGKRVALPALAEVSGSVYVRENATLTAPALAEVSGSVYVRENATLTAPALVKSGSVYVRENATLTAPALRTIGHVAYNTTIFGHEVRVHDGIGAVTVSEKSRDDITIRCCRHAKFEDGELVGDRMYVVSQGQHNAHGETLESAMADLAYKTADRDVSAYENIPMDTVKPPYEWATIYRVITGACQTGTEHFIKQQGELKDNYTLSEIIALTHGAYRSERFREVVQDPRHD